MVSIRIMAEEASQHGILGELPAMARLLSEPALELQNLSRYRCEVRVQGSTVEEHTFTMKPKRRLAFRSGLVLALLLIGVPVWIVGRAYRRERATHDLATALYKDDTRSALAALRAGADPNARRFEHDSPPTFGQSLRRFLQQLRGGKTVSEAEQIIVLRCSRSLQKRTTQRSYRHC